MDVGEDLRWWNVAVFLQEFSGLRGGGVSFLRMGEGRGMGIEYVHPVLLFGLCSRGTMGRWWFLGRLSTNLGLRSLVFLFQTFWAYNRREVVLKISEKNVFFYS